MNPASLALALLAFAASQPAWADLATSTTAIACRTSTGITAKWEGGRPKIEHTGEVWDFQYRNIDKARGTATFVSTRGESESKVIWGVTTLTFFNEGVDGVFVDTVITSSFRSPEPGRFVIMKSHHLPMLRHPIGSQYHGLCSVLK